jgi:hypothetical protein
VHRDGRDPAAEEEGLIRKSIRIEVPDTVVFGIHTDLLYISIRNTRSVIFECATCLQQHAGRMLSPDIDRGVGQTMGIEA